MIKKFVKQHLNNEEVLRPEIRYDVPKSNISTISVTDQL
jgi:hypothetical protein